VAARYSRRAARRAAIASRRSSGGVVPEGQRFPAELRLRRRSEFDAAYRAGKRVSSSYFTAFLRANDLPVSRFGFSIKKALGGAVVRNRIRRRLRELVRCYRKEIPTGWDIVIHPKGSVGKAPFPKLADELVRLLSRP